MFPLIKKFAILLLPSMANLVYLPFKLIMREDLYSGHLIEDLEVDPSHSGASNGSTEADSSLLRRNQTALMNAVKIVWQRLQANLRSSLASIRRTVKQRHGQEVADQLISGCLFLRYICPAIHGPTLFGLTNAIPDDPRVSRNLTLLAKVLQTIANFSHFEAKENYMRFLNDFVQSMQEEMHQFLRSVSTVEEKNNSGICKRQMTNVSNCHNNIDLGYELTMLYRQLKNILDKDPKVRSNIHLFSLTEEKKYQSEKKSRGGGNRRMFQRCKGETQR
ncbi:unnamed protein product [Rodentolepis nana]|uniref:Ras-GAP domain-containing protein n=1 Tax=Rodentolepis nana TaxID=102285 RepID=A0A0R3TPW5_RODNA|nr:unnamed protein product [Rodentolepis nana]